MHSERSGAARRRSDGDCRTRAHGGVEGRRHEDARGRARPLPVTVRFWDGSAVVARGDPDAPVVYPRRAAIAHILHAPNQLGLGARLGDGRAGRRRRPGERCCACAAASASSRRAPRARSARGRRRARSPGRGVLRRPPVPEFEAAPARAGCTRCAATGPRSAITTTSPTPSTGCCSARAWSTRARTSPSRGDSLEAAQERKLELICRKLRLAPGERLLDIGCGWGSLVLHAAAHYGVRGVGVTLSEPQAELARERIAAAGLGDRVEIRVLDYRELDRRAVRQDRQRRHVRARRPRRSSTRYVEHGARAAAPGGLFLNHGIARLHSAPAARPRRSSSRYVFPDGELHPVTDVMASLQDGGPRGARRRVAARALRAHAAALGARTSPRGRERGRRRGRRRARARLAAVHARLGARASRAATSPSTRCSPPAPGAAHACRSTARTCS